MGRGALHRAHRRSTGSRCRQASTGSPGRPSARCGSTPGTSPATADVDPSTGLVEVGLDGSPVDRVRVTVTGRGRDRGRRRPARDLLPRRGHRPSARRPHAGHRGHDLRAARAPAAARLHRRRPGSELRLLHRRPRRRGGVGHGARPHRDRGRPLDLRRRGGRPRHPCDAGAPASPSSRTPASGRPRPTATSPTWARSWPSTATRSASGRPRRATPARRCGCAGRTAGS